MNNGPPTYLSRSPPPLDDFCADDCVVETDEILSRFKSKMGVAEPDENANSRPRNVEQDFVAQVRDSTASESSRFENKSGDILTVENSVATVDPMQICSRSDENATRLGTNLTDVQKSDQFVASFDAFKEIPSQSTNFNSAIEENKNGDILAVENSLRNVHEPMQISSNSGENAGKFETNATVAEENIEFVADFDAFDENETGREGFENSTDGGDWANFQVRADDAQAPCTSSDWSANVNEEAPNLRVIAPLTDDQALTLSRLSSELDQILCSSFAVELCVEFVKAQATGLNSILLEDNIESQPNVDRSQMEHYCKLWFSLRSIEDSVALKYQFAESAAFYRYASALKMDVALAKLRRPNLPAFAWHLGATALTPERASDAQPSSGSPGQSLQPSADASLSDGSKSNNGLFNPLPNTSFNYGSLDLDVLIGDSQLVPSGSDSPRQRMAPSSSSTSIDSDLACSALPNNNIFNKIVQQQQQADGYSTSAPRREMSVEAINIVGNLPDLSFMLSPVLMFPVRGDCANSDNNN